MQSFWSRSRQSVSFYHYGEKQSHWCDRVSFTTWILNLLHHLVSSGMRNELLQLHEEHCSFEALKKHIVAHRGLKTEAEKRGLGSSIELKLRRLAKTAEGSKAFSINTQAQWKVERLLFGNSSVLQVHSAFHPFVVGKMSTSITGDKLCMQRDRSGVHPCRELRLMP